MSFVQTSDHVRFDPHKLCKNNLFETPQMFCDLYCLEPGQSQKLHRHSDAAKFYYVVEGRGRFQVGDAEQTLGKGGLAFSRAGEAHGVVNESQERLVLLVAMAPNPNVAAS